MPASSKQETVATTAGTSANTSANTSSSASNTSNANTSNANTSNAASGVNTNTSAGNINPWAPQQGALTDAFGNAQTAYDKASTAVAPTDFTAQMTPEQLTAFNSMIAQGSDHSVPASQAAAGGALTTAGTSGVAGALSGLASFDPSKTNNTASLIDSANKYADGQDIDAQVRNAMLNATQTARDVTLPGINQNAAVTGNTNSTRTGIAEGLVQRGLAEQSTDLGATLRNKAFTDGLTLAQTQANNNNTGALSALSNSGVIGNAAANSGNAATNSSVTNNGILSSEQLAGATGLQAADQAKLDNLLKQYQSGTSSPYDALNGLMSIIGSQNWGQSSSSTNTGATSNTENGATNGVTNGTSNTNASGSGTSQDSGSTTGNSNSTTTKTPSAWEIISGLMSAGGALMSGIGGPTTPSVNTDVGNGAGGHPIVTYR